MRKILLFIIMLKLLTAGQEIGTEIVTNPDGTLNYIKNSVFLTIKEDEIEYFKTIIVYNEKDEEIAKWEVHTDDVYIISTSKIYPEDILNKWICMKSPLVPNMSTIRPEGMKGSKVIVKMIENDKIMEQEFPAGKFTTTFSDGTKQITEFIDGEILTKNYDKNGNLIE